MGGAWHVPRGAMHDSRREGRVGADDVCTENRARDLLGIGVGTPDLLRTRQGFVPWLPGHCMARESRKGPAPDVWRSVRDLLLMRWTDDSALPLDTCCRGGEEHSDMLF